ERRRALSPDGAEAPPPPKIVVSDAIHPGAREHLAANAELVDVDGTDVPALLAAVAEAEALIVRSETQVTAEVIAAAPRLSVVAQRLAAFEMILIAYDPYVTEERFAELGVRPVDYEELLREADVVTYHVPSTAETHHMLNAARIEFLKPDAIVLNCARGEVV